MGIRKLLFAFLTLGLLFTAVGCDSDNGGEGSEADLFVDAWAAVGVTDASGDQTQAFGQAVSEFLVTFAGNGTYSLSVVFRDQRSPIQFSGATYTVNEGADQITLVIPAAVTGAGNVPLAFGYTFSNSNNTVQLTVASGAQVVLINALFGTTYAAPVTITLQRQ